MHTKLDRLLSNNIFNLVINKSFEQTYNKNGENQKGKDQDFLEHHVYKLLVNRSTIHDSYSCRRFANSKPFPTERKIIDHIGSVYYSPIKKIKECPIECRPPNHLDWKYC